ncbi:MAG: hypothetical protein ABL995_17585 [Bryobacteraceae bacterium]
MITAAEVQTAAAASSTRDVMQTVAHELRQPLSAMESTAYYLGLVLPRTDERAHAQVSRLRQMVDQLNWILSCGLQVADDRPPSPERIDLEEFVTQAVASATPSTAPRPVLALAGDLPPVLLDPGRGRALMANLLSLFQQIADGQYRIQIQTLREPSEVALSISVDTPGLASEAVLGPGSALCLDGVRRTVYAHEGTVALRVDPVDGVRLRITLPIT